MRTKWILRRGAIAIFPAFALLSLSAGMVDSRDTAVRAELTRDGSSIVVVDPRSGAVLHSIPKPAGLVREVFALEQGAVVATTFGDVTEFLNADTGAMTRRLDEPVHATSHDGTRMVTFSSDRRVIVRDYPALSVKRVLEDNSAWGPSAVKFSPDDRFVAIEFCNHYPLTDEQFKNPVFDATLYQTKLYEVASGAVVPGFSGMKIGGFSEDGRFLTSGKNRFDLRTRAWADKPTEDAR